MANHKRRKPKTFWAKPMAEGNDRPRTIQECRAEIGESEQMYAFWEQFPDYEMLWYLIDEGIWEDFE
jgi:hypothetical protein